MGYNVVESGKTRQVKSLWLAERLLLLNWYFVFFFVAVEVGLYVWKGENLPFVSGILLQEVILLFLTAFTELFRLSMGQLANIVEMKGTAIAFVVYTVLCGVAVAYFAVWQTYVLRVEFLLCVAYIAILVLEVVLFIVGIIVYRS